MQWLQLEKFGFIGYNILIADPSKNLIIEGKTDFDEIGYGGPAPPNGRHTYIFKGYALRHKIRFERRLF